MAPDPADFRLPASATAPVHDDHVVPIRQAARYADCAERTLYRYVERGWLTPYRREGSRALFLDLDEIERDLPRLPRRLARPSRSRLGANARAVRVLPAASK